MHAWLSLNTSAIAAAARKIGRQRRQGKARLKVFFESSKNRQAPRTAPQDSRRDPPAGG